MVVLAGIALGLLAWLLLRGARAPEPPPPLVATAPAAVSQPTAPRPAESIPIGTASATASASAGGPLQKPREFRYEVLKNLIEQNRFPPDSRPLTRAMDDLLRPNRRHDSAVPVRVLAGQKVDPSRELENEPHVLFTGPRFSIPPGEPLVATLEVLRGPPESQGRGGPRRLPIEITRTRVDRFARPDFIPSGTYSFRDDGREGDALAGDLVYTASFLPSTLEGMKGFRGPVHVLVEFRIAEVDSLAKAGLEYIVDSRATATFTGQTSERATDAGLELSVGVEVVEPGAYVIAGLLFDSRNQPVGHATFRGTLDAGTRAVPLRFWGLLFHDAHAVDGPLRTVTGKRLAAQGEPFDADMPAWAGEFRTRPHRVAEFSDREWESDEKTQVLTEARRLADENPAYVDQEAFDIDTAPGGSVIHGHAAPPPGSATP